MTYTCHLLDVRPAFPTPPSLVSKEECLTVRMQATFKAHESFKVSLKGLTSKSLNFVVVVVVFFFNYKTEIRIGNRKGIVNCREFAKTAC